MRIVTRPDFDGVVCAVLLIEALGIDQPVKWVQPSAIQKGQVEIKEGDIIANLPYHRNCSLWFDHHYSNKPDMPYNGLFKIAPSAAGVVYEYYKDNITTDVQDLVRQTDKIDSADLNMDEILRPEKYPFILLSMTLSSRQKDDEPYWNRIVDLLGHKSMDRIMKMPEIQQRCDTVIQSNKAYEGYLRQYTREIKHVSVTDFRLLDPVPEGNRFLVYSIFPNCVVSVKIHFDEEGRGAIGVGHSIVNRNCNVNVGQMLSRFEGGGHRGAGACRFKREKADDYLSRIIDILVKNQPETPVA